MNMITCALQFWRKSNQHCPNRYFTSIIKSNQLKSNQRLVFWMVGENRSTRGKTSQGKVQNQQTQHTADAESGNRTRALLVGGEYSHHNATTALLRTDIKLSHLSDSQAKLLTLIMRAVRQLILAIYISIFCLLILETKENVSVCSLEQTLNCMWPVWGKYHR